MAAFPGKGKKSASLRIFGVGALDPSFVVREVAAEAVEFLLYYKQKANKIMFLLLCQADLLLIAWVSPVKKMERSKIICCQCGKKVVPFCQSYFKRSISSMALRCDPTIETS